MIGKKQLSHPTLRVARRASPQGERMEQENTPPRERDCMSTYIRRLITGLFLLAIAAIAWYLPAIYSSLLLATLVIIISVVEWPVLAQSSVWLWLLTPLYPVVPFIVLIDLNQHESTRVLLLLVFIIAAAHDTGAYVVGKLIGRHRIAPTISPGKTWEGLCGGTICTGIALVLFLSYIHLSWSWSYILIFTIIVSLVAFFGDLFESWLKRRAGVKDSGKLLPGHGGLLDRFDSIMFVGLSIYIFKGWLIKIL